MWVMVSGPYSAGTATGTSADDDSDARAVNLATLNRAALSLLRAGHLPIVGVNLSRPIARLAAEDPTPLIQRMSMAAVERCDACLRIGGESAGADAEVARFRALGRPVYTRLEDVPPPEPA